MLTKFEMLVKDNTLIRSQDIHCDLLLTNTNVLNCLSLVVIFQECNKIAQLTRIAMQFYFFRFS